MVNKIIKNTENTVFDGCDFVIELPSERKNGDITVLQLTDTQVIDAHQRRTPDRLRPDEIEAWATENFDIQLGDHIRSLVAQCRPDLIIITGDVVYGSFDDNGTALTWLCSLMDQLDTPWAPVFGNHDNECALGVEWQCNLLENSKNCLFKRGSVSGNGNYTVGIAVGDELVRVLHMLDSNGCWDSDEPSVIRNRGLCIDQLQLVSDNTERIRKAQGKKVSAFAAFHIPEKGFVEAAIANGYRVNDTDRYVIGVTHPAKYGDFGFCLEKYIGFDMSVDFTDFALNNGIDGVFAGHVHNCCTSIEHRGIRWTFGLKTGQYDYHIPGQIGGTEITLNGSAFKVRHLPSLVHLAPMPIKAPMFGNFFADGELKK